MMYFPGRDRAGTVPEYLRVPGRTRFPEGRRPQDFESPTWFGFPHHFLNTSTVQPSSEQTIKSTAFNLFLAVHHVSRQ